MNCPLFLVNATNILARNFRKNSKKNFEEKISRKNARRSIVTYGRIKKGEILSEKNLIMKRPGTGISPTELKKIIGKIAKKNLQDDYVIKFSDVKKR